MIPSPSSYRRKHDAAPGQVTMMAMLPGHTYYNAKDLKKELLARLREVRKSLYSLKLASSNLWKNKLFAVFGTLAVGNKLFLIPIMNLCGG